MNHIVENNLAGLRSDSTENLNLWILGLGTTRVLRNFNMTISNKQL